MRVLEFIDQWLIDKFESFAYFMERTFGIPVRSWERGCLALAFTFLIMEPRVGDWYVGLHIAFKALLSISFLGRLISNLTRPKSNISESVAMNPNRRFDPVRVLGIGILALVSWHDIQTLNLWFEFSNLGYWFSACNDLPPGVSRIRKLLNSIQASFGKLTPVRSEG